MSDMPQGAQLLFNSVMNAWLSPTLWVAVQFRLADHLAAGPAGAGHLAKLTGAHEDSLRRILNALCGVGVFRRLDNGDFAGTETSAILCYDHPAGLAALIDVTCGGEHGMAWHGLHEAVKTGGCAFEIFHGKNWVDELNEHPSRRDAFAKAMTATTRAVEDAVLSAHDFGKFDLAIDVGGSQGTMVGGLLQRYPNAHGIVFDLPDTVKAGQASWQNAPFANRLQAVGGSFFDSVPSGDLYLLKQVLHDWRDEESTKILKTIRRAARPGARVAIIEMVLPDTMTPHMGWGLDVAMMAMTGGRERSRAEYETLLHGAGFEPIGCYPTPSTHSVLEARAA